MPNLWLYGALSRYRFLNYRAKIMVVAFVGTHVPLVALVTHVAAGAAADWASRGCALFQGFYLGRPVPAAGFAAAATAPVIAALSGSLTRDRRLIA